MDAFGKAGRTVAELAGENDEVIGGIMFSTVHIQGAEHGSACILAPLAVVAEQSGARAL